MLSITIGALFGLVAFSTATPASDYGTAQNCKKTLSPPSSAGKLAHTGINIAGFDFGCGTDGVGRANCQKSFVRIKLKLMRRLAKLLPLGRHSLNIMVNLTYLLGMQ